MTVNVENPDTPYAPTGSTPGPFATVWSFASPSEVQVVIETDGVLSAPLVLNTDYSLATSAAPGDGLTGAVTMLAPGIPAGGWQSGAVRRLLLRRRTAMVQGEPFGQVDGFRPPVAERAWDRDMRLHQEHRADLVRAVSTPIGEPGFLLLPIAERAGSFMAFDAEGRQIPAVGVPSSPVTPFMQTVNDDTTAAQARATLGADRASNVLHQSAGTGGQQRTVQGVIDGYAIMSERYAAGGISGGDDISYSTLRAIDAAATRVANYGGLADVILPGGPAFTYFNTTQSLILPTGVHLWGRGQFRTLIRRIGDFHTLIMGTPNPAANVENAGVHRLGMIHDHGNGFFPSITPGSWVNPVSADKAHIIAYSPANCSATELQLNMMPYGLIIQGGTGFLGERISTIAVWEHSQPTLQEGIAALMIDQDLSVTAGIPTGHELRQCQFGGWTRTGVTVNYPGGFSKVTTKNIGPKNNVKVKAGEQINFNGCYTGAASESGLVLSSKSARILANVGISGHFFDPCGTDDNDYQLKFENEDTTGQVDGCHVTNSQFLGQTTGKGAIGDRGSTALYGSVRDLTVSSSSANAFVATPVDLTNMRRAIIDMAIGSYNWENWYTGDRAAAVYVNSQCNSVKVSGALGGGILGERAAGPNNRCIHGVYADDARGSAVEIFASNAGMTGKLFFGVPDQTHVNTSVANFNLQAGVDAPYQYHSATLTSNITATLLTTGAVDGDVFMISRTGGGAFTLTVVGASSKALASGFKVLFRFSAASVLWLIEDYGAL